MFIVRVFLGNKKVNFDYGICKQCNIVTFKLPTGITVKCILIYSSMLRFSIHGRLRIKTNRFKFAGLKKNP